MHNQDQIIAIRENAKAELMSLKTIEDGMDHLSKLKGIEAWVKAQKLDAELMVIVMEQELRTKRIVGKLLKAGKESGEIRKKEDNQHSASDAKELADLGLTKKAICQLSKNSLHS